MTKLMVVDDEPKIRAMLASLLEAEGLEVATVESGEEALKQIRHEPPQLMILDVKLGRMSGLELLRRVRDTLPGVGVFLLTGYDSDEIESQAASLGAWGVIHKPLVLSDIRQTIKDALSRLPS